MSALAALLCSACEPTLAVCRAPDGSLVRCVDIPKNYICPYGIAVAGEATADGLVRCASCGPIATINGIPSELGTSCELIALGAAKRVGTTAQFGGSESQPRGLAAIGNTLYMTGSTEDWLYTLNINNGTAERVDTSALFGVLEQNPYDLATVDNTLYMVGLRRGGRLYTLNPTTGAASQVGTVNMFGVGEISPTGLSAIGNTLYMTGSSKANLYTLNIDSTDMTPDSTASRVGNVDLFGLPMGAREEAPTGLAAIGNTLYMVGEDTDALYIINVDPEDMTADGSAIRVGNATRFGQNEDLPRGLAAIGDILYMIGEGNRALYTLRYE